MFKRSFHSGASREKSESLWGPGNTGTAVLTCVPTGEAFQRQKTEPSITINIIALDLSFVHFMKCPLYNT